MQDQASRLAEVVSVFKLERAHGLTAPAATPRPALAR
jgi:hypothetical protein